MNILREYLSRFITRRRKVRSSIREKEHVDRILHFSATGVLLMNTALILYVSLSIVLRMTLAGLDILDSLPVLFYILPLLVILPSLTYAYYTTRSAAINFIIILISSAFFYVLATLVRGFIICLILNILALGILFLMGGFRPQGKITDVGKKGIAWFIILNLLGLAFPISVSLMGQNPIVYVESQDASIILEYPLSSSKYFEPNSTFIGQLEDTGFGIHFLISEDDEVQWNRLTAWLNATNSTQLPVAVSFMTNRSNLSGYANTGILTTEFFTNLYSRYSNSLERITTLISESNYTFDEITVRFDMTLSRSEWQHFMSYIKDVNLVGFSSFIRDNIDSLNASAISEMESELISLGESDKLVLGFILESFVLDDLIDGDTLLSKMCGVTVQSLRENTQLANLYDIRRSRFTDVMDGDVGEYLSHSYSRSAGLANSGLRLGNIGHSVYDDAQLVRDDLQIMMGNGASVISISALPEIIENDDFSSYEFLTDMSLSVGVTYTFRIFAFRAVFIAIDSFDFLLF